jgi:hypothetical protein
MLLTGYSADQEIEDQTQDDGTKKEGIPGQQGRLDREPSLSESLLWSEMF